MKKLFVLMLAIAMAAGVSAQDTQKKEKPKKTPEERAEKITNKMKDKLSLSDDQVQKIKAINLDAATKTDAARAEAGDDKAAAKEKIKTINKERDEKIQEVLTADQKTKYAEMKKEGKEKMKAKRGKHKNGATGGESGGN